MVHVNNGMGNNCVGYLFPVYISYYTLPSICSAVFVFILCFSVLSTVYILHHLFSRLSNNFLLYYVRSCYIAITPGESITYEYMCSFFQ